MDFIHGLVALQSARMHGNGMKKLSRSRALELVWIVWIDHGVVAGAKVAGFLPGPRWHAAALVAADVAHLVAHLVVPVVAAANGAAGRAVWFWQLKQGSGPAAHPHPHLLLLLHLLWIGSNSGCCDSNERKEEELLLNHLEE